MPVGFRNRRFDLVTLCVGTALAFAAAGCQQATPTGSPVTADPDTGSADTLVGTPDVAGTPGTAGPVSERDMERAKAFAEAIAGLRFENGVVTVERRLPGDETDAWAHHREGEAFKATNRKTESIRSFAHAVRIAPDVPDFYLALGDAFIAKGKTEHAAASYRSAADLDDENVEALSKLALTMAREGRQDEAIETMQSVLVVDPDYGFAHERLAIWHYYAGDDTAAWQHVRHARRIGHSVPPQFVALLERRTPE